MKPSTHRALERITLYAAITFAVASGILLAIFIVEGIFGVRII